MSNRLKWWGYFFGDSHDNSLAIFRIFIEFQKASLDLLYKHNGSNNNNYNNEIRWNEKNQARFYLFKWRWRNFIFVNIVFICVTFSGVFWTIQNARTTRTFAACAFQATIFIFKKQSLVWSFSVCAIDITIISSTKSTE